MRVSFDCQRGNIESVFPKSWVEDSYGSVEEYRRRRGAAGVQRMLVMGDQQDRREGFKLYHVGFRQAVLPFVY